MSTISPIPGSAVGIELLGVLSPYLRHCGESHRPAWHIASRRLLDFLLVYIDDGDGRFTVGDSTFDVQPGDLAWIPPDTLHEMEGFAPAMYCTYLHFDLIYRSGVSHWDFSIPGGMQDLSELEPLMHPPLPDGPLRELGGLIRGPNNLKVAGLMHQACQEASKGQAYSSVLISGLITQLVAEILNGTTSLKAGASHHVPAIDEAATYIREHCTRKLRVDEAAEVAGLSVSYFRTLFLKQFGCSPRAYQRNCRVQQAKQLMMEHRLNLSQIAERCGFATVHSFSRAFRECEGKSPSQYRSHGKQSIRVEGSSPPYL